MNKWIKRASVEEERRNRNRIKIKKSTFRMPQMELNKQG